MTAPAVVRGSNQNRVIAACSALMGRCHARRCRQTDRATSKQRRVAPRTMPDRIFPVSADWVSNTRANVLAWWAPKSAHGPLALWRHQPVDECLSKLALHIPVLGRIHKPDAVLVEHAPVTLNQQASATNLL